MKRSQKQQKQKSTATRPPPGASRYARKIIEGRAPYSSKTPTQVTAGGAR